MANTPSLPRTRARADRAIESERTRPDIAAFVRARVLAHGYNSNDFLALYQGWRYFASEVPTGVVMYQERAGVYVACGDPICAEADLPEVLEHFAAFAAARGRRCAFLGASERLAAVAAAVGFGALKVGEEPFFDLATYAPRGDRAKKVRSAVNQARRIGVAARPYDPCEEDAALEREAAALCRAWQAGRPAGEMGFGLTLEPFTGRELKRYFIAQRGGRMVGLLACSPMPARNGWYLEDVIRAPDAPNGTTELLITTALEALRAEGAALATLGVAPLAGVETQPYGRHRALSRALRLTREHCNQLYNFKSLAHYKRKYAPTFWEGSYLLYRPARISPRLLWSLIAVFTPESPLATLRHGLDRRVPRGVKRFPRPRVTLPRPPLNPATAALALAAGLAGLLGPRVDAGARMLPLIHLHLWTALILLLAVPALVTGIGPLRLKAGGGS